MWFLIAFFLSLILPVNGIFLSLCHGIFGRLYIIYFFIKYHQEFFIWMQGIKECL